jgi:YHS domain-containing protein
MKIGARNAIVCFSLMACAGASIAQHQGHQNTGTASTSGGPCLAHAREGLRIVESTNRLLEEARQTNSPREMRTAMSELQAALAEVRTQLSLCVSSAADPSAMNGMDHSNMSEAKPAPAPAAPAKDTVDPVCGMKVETRAAEKATYQGKTYSFCSRADREKFLSDPASFVKR